MRIRQIKLMNFMSYDSKIFDLPENGLIYITGANGTGKSSILEAVSVCLWGKSLRGASPWRDGQKGKVVIELVVNGKTLVVKRERDTNDKKSLSFTVDGSGEQYPTATKAQEALCTHVGQWDPWRKTSVLSSQDAAHFSSATDAEKKRLLETLIGLERFEVAQKEAKDQTNGIKERLAKAQATYQSHQTSVAVLSASLGRLIESRGILEKMAGTQEAKRAQLLEEIQQAKSQVAKINSNLAALRSEQVAAQQELASTTRALDLHIQANATECFACGSKLKQAPDDRHKDLTLQSANLQAKIVYLSGQLRQQQTSLQMAAFKQSSLEGDLRQLDSTAIDSLQVVNKQVEQTEQELTAKQLEATEAKYCVDTAEQELSVNAHTIELLSIRRIRNRLLLDAIALATPLIQQRLAQLSDNITVEISPTSEMANGNTKDAISLKITGAGGSDGYTSCSGGQRRRIDVGILLGLADLACAYTGQDRESLFLDEIFDALDGQGIERIQDLLLDIASKEQVFLISHTQMVLPSTLHIITG